MGDENQDNGLEDSEGGADPEITPVVLHPLISHSVNTSFECPLRNLCQNDYQYTFAAAQESARLGCPYCILHTFAIRELIPDITGSDKIADAHECIFTSCLVRGHEIVLAGDLREHDFTNHCEFYGDYAGSTDPGGCMSYFGCFVPCDTSSNESLQTAQKWLRTCDEEHDCTKSAAAELPRRVLDIRNNNVRLYLTNIEDSGSKYACLSHCWGTSPETLLRTTPNSLDDHLKGISWDRLPPTFQDAVSFTRKLGISFLWIDALCIIQGDARDWQEQSSVMADIYRGAYITLAATSSRNSNGGCYTRSQERPVRRASSPLAIAKYQDGTEKEIFARVRFKHDVKSLPLFTRGWCYQERILSPRVLHFMDEELVWECCDMVACECRDDILEDRMDMTRISDSNSVSLVGFWSRGEFTWPLNLWYQIVDEYTALSLTHRSDIFPALSGIAKAFAKKIDSEYIAGMWKRTLVSNLLWFPELSEQETQYAKPGTLKDLNNQWRAPSWSWASHDWQSRFRVLSNTKELAEVPEISCQVSGADPTGELAFGNLTLRTKFAPVRFDHSSKTVDFDGFIIQKASPELNIHDVTFLCTCYLGVNDKYLENQSNLLLAQIAECTGKIGVAFKSRKRWIRFAQEVRLFMLLAKRGDNESDGWIRIGLATIAIYECSASLFAAYGGKYRYNVVKGMTRKQIRMAMEDKAEKNRAVFRRLDQLRTQDLVVW